MAFIQPCFIRKNTPEIRKKLEELGHTICDCCKFDGADWLHITAIKDIYRTVHGIGFLDEEIAIYGLVTQEDIFNRFLKTTKSVDCGTNEELFLALAALRDDSDYMQWFIMDCDVYLHINKGDWFISTDINKGKHIGTQIDPMYCHKATVEEIIEHFK